MEVPRGTLSTETLLSIASDDNIRRYHEAAIDLYEAERAIDSVVPHDDPLNFEELFASRPSASSFVCDRAPDESDLSREFDLCIGSGSCSSSMGSAVALVSSINSEDFNASISDELEIRTFTIRKIHSSVVKRFVATRGITVNKISLSIEIVSPSKIRRLIAVAGRNAVKILDWIL